MENNFLTIIRAFNLLKSGDRVLLAVSGGMDSVTMLDLMLKTKKSLKLKLLIAHVNHGTRETSARDERFVANLAKKNKLPFFSTRLTKLPDKSEETLRDKRYEFFSLLTSSLKIDAIAVAHHKDDNIETGLINLLRGSGFRGLSGISIKNGTVIRPMLPFSRSEIKTYAEKNKLKWMEDESNGDTTYFRNKIRHLLIPYLENKIMPEFRSSFFNLMLASKDADDFILLQARDAMTKIENSDGSLDLKGFKVLHRALQKEIIKLKILEISGDLRSVEAVHLESAIRAIGAEQSPKTIEFPRGLKITKRFAKVAFELKR